MPGFTELTYIIGQLSLLWFNHATGTGGLHFHRTLYSASNISEIYWDGQPSRILTIYTFELLTVEARHIQQRNNKGCIW